MSIGYASAESLQTSEAILTLPENFSWARNEYGAGEPQSASIDGATLTTLTRKKAINLFAHINSDKQQTYDLWGMDFDVDGHFPTAQEHLQALRKTTATQGGVQLRPPQYMQVTIDKHECNRTSAAARFNGTQKFPDKVFDLYLIRHECFLPERKKMVRIEFSERLLAGKASSGEEFISDLMQNLRFSKGNMTNE